MNTSLSKAAMGIGKKANGSDWAAGWIDGWVNGPHEYTDRKRARERLCICLSGGWVGGCTGDFSGCP